MTTRFELVDEGFADPCLTTWPRHHIWSEYFHSIWSGRRGSNSLPPPWQGGALPDELRPHIGAFTLAPQGKTTRIGLEPTTPSVTGWCSNQLSYRAISGVIITTPLWSGRRGSNSLPPPWQGGALPDELNPQIWCFRTESNHRHEDFQSSALPTELQKHKWRPGTGSNRRPPA